MHPQPNDIWRIDWQLPPNTDIEAEQASGLFDRRVRAVIGDLPYEIDWLSTYRFHQRVVEAFRLGRIFFAGDAAHSLPPYGSRGMNSGIQDADNLAWKLALVLRGEAEDRLLDTYHQERYAAAKENLRITEATIRFMVPPNPARRLARTLLLRLSQPLKGARDRINSGRMAEPYVYDDSPIVDPPHRHPLLGSFAPDGRIVTEGATRLRQLFGRSLTGLCFADDLPAALRFATEAQAAAPLATEMVLVLSEPQSEAALARPDDLPTTVTVLTDPDGALRAAYRIDRPACFVVRPDGHIAAVLEHLEPDMFAAAVARCSAAVVRPTAVHPPVPLNA
jgi:3-(3-hydroxy-phenyl)propionate hydroxylase